MVWNRKGSVESIYGWWKHPFSLMFTGKLQLSEIEEDHWKKKWITLFHPLPMVLKVYSSSMGSNEFPKQSPISNFINISLVDSKLWLCYELWNFCKGAVVAMEKKQRKFKSYIWNNWTHLDEIWNKLHFLLVELSTSSKAIK